MKVKCFKELIKYIRSKILTPEYNELQITIYDDCISFSIYEMFDVTIEVSKEKIYTEDLQNCKKEFTVKFKPEFIHGDMSVDEVKEVSEICEFLKENLDIVIDVLEE